MIVVSDTTPLTYLLQLKYEFLLEGLYQKLIIPPAVQEELLGFAPTRAASENLFRAEWICIQKPTSLIELPPVFKIDKGEWEAISLALEIKAGLVLIDERLGTALAKQHNLQTIGLLGILIEAKRQHLITAVKPLLDLLIEKRIFLTKNLYHKILTIVNE